MVSAKDGRFTETEYKNTDRQDFGTRDQNLCERFNNFKKLITVEPVAFLALFSSNLASITSQTLALQKACRVNLKLGDEICESLLKQDQSNDLFSYEKLVQKYYSSQVLWKSTLETLLTCILLLFIGGWSDRTGRRKFVVIVPVIGGTLSALSNIINVIFFNQLPLQVQIFFEVLFIYGTGGFSVTLLGLLNYICDITTIENRTHRLGIISLCTFVSAPLGMSLSGIIFKLYGYYAIYGTCLIIDMVTILYIIYRVSDPARSEEQMKYDGQGLMKFFKTFFNLTTIRDTIKIVCKKTSNNRRIRLCLLLVSVTIVYGPIIGEAAIVYMATRYRFNWDEVRYSVFQTYRYITAFLGPGMDLFNATAMIAIKSMVSKFLDSTEIGKFNSLVAVMENLTPVMYVPMYTKVYTLTMDSFPGAVYLIGVPMVIPAIFVFIWLLYKHKRDVKIEKQIQQ